MRYVTLNEGKPWNETGEKLLVEDANGKKLISRNSIYERSYCRPGGGGA